mmetsp:Transcript_45639/g.93200  ORF Transcript_45639/g.93200 Transcript_45639/m.93200 type:complete len:258 (-) Transcript_45639:239-1012(-)
MNLLDTRLTKGHLGGEIWQVCDSGRNIGALIRGRSSHPFQHLVAEAGAGVGHRQGRAALAGFGLDHLSPAILRALVQGWNLVCGDGGGDRVLREDRHDGHPSVATDHWHFDVRGAFAGDLCHEFVGAHNIQGSHSHDFQWIQTLLLVELRHGRHDGVHRVHDDANHGFRAELGACLHDALGDVCVDVEQIVAGHARLPRHSSRNQHQIASCQTCFQLFRGRHFGVSRIAHDLTGEFQMPEIRGHSGRRHSGHADVLH